MIRRALQSALLCGLVACSASAHSLRGGGVSPLTVRSVEWNPAHADVGDVVAVADEGTEVVVFSDGAATVLAGGSAVATDRSIAHWKGASVIAAADGSGRWIAGVDDAGHLYRLRNRATFVDVSDRYGLAKDKIAGVAPLGPRLVAIDLGEQVAVADGAHVTRYAASGRSSGAPIAAGGAHVAIAGDPIVVFDLAAHTSRTFVVPGFSKRKGALALNAAGKLFVATSGAIYSEDEQGVLRLRYEGRVDGLAAAGARVWFAAGEELGVIDAEVVRASSGLHLPKGASLVGSSSGDVWALADGKLARYASDERGGPSWDATVGPVFKRACTPCHNADGDSGVDLSSEGRWVSEKDRIKMRVLVRKTMPPTGHPLADADREAIRAWIEGPAGVPAKP